MVNNNLIDKEQYEAQLNDRWDWITEDIADAETKLNTQLVLENSYKYMISDNSIPRNWLEDNILSEDVIEEAPQKSGSVGDYVIPKVMFPIIRRVMPELIANKLVSVQPIQAPTGVIYYITYDYSNTKGTITAKDEFSANPQQTKPAFATYYTSEKIGPFAKSVDVASTVGATVELDFGAQEGITEFLGIDLTKYTIKRFELYNTTTGKAVPVTYNKEGTGTLTFDPATGDIKATVNKDDLSVPAEGAEDISNEFEVFLVYDQEGSSNIPEMEFHIDHMNVNTTERKLKVRWTKEAEQDMMAYHKINVEQELVKVASIQTAYEQDREVMRFIDDHILTDLMYTHNWVKDGAGDGTANSGNNTQGNYLDRHRCLAQRLYAASTKVAAFNHLGPCDWAVCSPKLAAVLQMLPDWKAGEIASGKSTFYNAGALGNGSLAIYVDPNRCGNDEDEITLGYKSKDSTYGAGVVYSPYANWMSGTVVNPENFNNIRGFFSRYALTMAPRGEYNYAKVRVNNL